METIRQKILRAAYPLLMKATRWSGKNAGVLQNKAGTLFKTSIYTIKVTLNTGDTLPLKTWQGKKILFVNTASNCGYTAQYDQLQQLQERYKQTVQVLGFPANDFKEQESGSDQAIAAFCSTTFGVTFPLAKKSSVVKGPQQHPVYRWLTHSDQNGWNDKAPDWNFSKYLVNEQGLLTHYFGPGVEPLGTEVLQAIEA